VLERLKGCSKNSPRAHKIFERRGRPEALGKANFSAPITFGRHHRTMSDATATPEPKPQPSLFTRVRVVEAELETMKALVAGLSEDHNALREDRDEWRWRAELLLAQRKEEFLDRWGRRIARSAKAFVGRLNALRPGRELSGALDHSPTSGQSSQARQAEG
jgi:hypothetical protein